MSYHKSSKYVAKSKLLNIGLNYIFPDITESNQLYNYPYSICPPYRAYLSFFGFTTTNAGKLSMSSNKSEYIIFFLST